MTINLMIEPINIATKVLPFMSTLEKMHGNGTRCQQNNYFSLFS